MKLSKTRLLLVLLSIALGLSGYFLLGNKPNVPPLDFTTLKGERFTTESLRGKVVLVNFWSTDCPGCVREMPQLIATYNKYQAAGFDTVAVAMYYDPPNYVLNFATKNTLPFKVVLDIKGEAALAFGGVQLTPTSFIVDKRGRVVHKILGEPDFVELHRLIEKKLAEKVTRVHNTADTQGAPQVADNNGKTKSFKRA